MMISLMFIHINAPYTAQHTLHPLSDNPSAAGRRVRQHTPHRMSEPEHLVMRGRVWRTADLPKPHEITVKRVKFSSPSTKSRVRNLLTKTSKTKQCDPNKFPLKRCKPGVIFAKCSFVVPIPRTLSQIKWSRILTHWVWKISPLQYSSQANAQNIKHLERRIYWCGLWLYETVFGNFV